MNTLKNVLFHITMTATSGLMAWKTYSDGEELFAIVFGILAIYSIIELLLDQIEKERIENTNEQRTETT